MGSDQIPPKLNTIFNEIQRFGFSNPEKHFLSRYQHTFNDQYDYSWHVVPAQGSQWVQVAVYNPTTHALVQNVTLGEYRQKAEKTLHHRPLTWTEAESYLF